MAGISLTALLAGNGYLHPQSHIAQFYSDRGDLARRIALRLCGGGRGKQHKACDEQFPHRKFPPSCLPGG